MAPLESYSLPEIWLGTFAVAGAVSLLSSAFGVFFERFAARYRIFDEDVPAAQQRHERRAYLRFLLLLATCATPFLGLGWIRFGAEGPLQIVLTFAAIWTGWNMP